MLVRIVGPGRASKAPSDVGAPVAGPLVVRHLDGVARAYDATGRILAQLPPIADEDLLRAFPDAVILAPEGLEQCMAHRGHS